MSVGSINRERLPFPQLTVLVVEDHDDTREMLHLLLEIWGCRVVEARNGLEAVEAALRERPRIILMDGELPVMDGLEATRRIRETELRDQINILALNGWGTPRYHVEAMAAGCDDSIDKPIDFDRLWKYLFRLCLPTQTLIKTNACAA